MFPSYDRDVLGSILAMHEGQFEAAMEALLEMGDPDGGGGAAAVAPSTARELGLPELNTDEELAMAIQQSIDEQATARRRQAGAAPSPPMPRERSLSEEELVQQADTDGDGSIDFDEFMALLQFDPTINKAGNLSDMFGSGKE